MTSASLRQLPVDPPDGNHILADVAYTDYSFEDMLLLKCTTYKQQLELIGRKLNKLIISSI